MILNKESVMLEKVARIGQVVLGVVVLATEVVQLLRRKSADPHDG